MTVPAPGPFPRLPGPVLLEYEEAIRLLCDDELANGALATRDACSRALGRFGVAAQGMHEIETQIFQPYLGATQPQAPAALPEPLVRAVRRLRQGVVTGRVRCWAVPDSEATTALEPVKDPTLVTWTSEMTAVVTGLWPVRAEPRILVFLEEDVRALTNPQSGPPDATRRSAPPTGKADRKARTDWDRRACAEAMRQQHARTPFGTRREVAEAITDWADMGDGAPPSPRTVRRLATELEAEFWPND